jgi:hypothetical protein
MVKQKSELSMNRSTNLKILLFILITKKYNEVHHMIVNQWLDRKKFAIKNIVLCLMQSSEYFVKIPWKPCT